jgi:hypothetical protein
VRIHPVLRVDGPGSARVAVDMHFVVQVRAAGMSCGADLADRLPDDHRIADLHKGLGMQVAVPGDDPAGVGNVQVPAFSAPCEPTRR